MTDGGAVPALARILNANMGAVLAEWLQLLKSQGGTGGGRIKDAELQTQCRDFLAALRQALSATDAAEVQAAPVGVVLSSGEYYGLVSALSVSLIAMVAALGAACFAFR